MSRFVFVDGNYTLTTEFNAGALEGLAPVNNIPKEDDPVITKAQSAVSGNNVRSHAVISLAESHG